MSRFLLLLIVPVSLAGCVSFSSSDPQPPARTTVVTPPAGSSTTVCSPGPC